MIIGNNVRFWSLVKMRIEFGIKICRSWDFWEVFLESGDEELNGKGMGRVESESVYGGSVVYLE